MVDKIISLMYDLRNRICFRNLSVCSEDSDLIRKLIFTEKAFMLSRFGNVEFDFINFYYRVNYTNSFFKNSLFFFRKEYPNDSRNRVSVNAGVSNFSPSNYKQFYDLYVESIRDIDFFFRWFSGDRLIETLGFKGTVFPLNTLNILDNPSFYSGVFDGKSVLVVSPFNASINYQLDCNFQFIQEHLGIDNIFVEVITSPFSVTSDDDWFDNLQLLKTSIRNAALDRNIDYVILGCGAFGLPLASFCKTLGISSLHLGGVTQLLFGIRGSRWSGYDLSKDGWINPISSDIPTFSNMIEGGCYW